MRWPRRSGPGRARPLEEIYPVVYCDALVVKVRDGRSALNKAAHIAVGIDLDGVKHVLGIPPAGGCPSPAGPRHDRLLFTGGCSM
jgi:hypothetical protein